MKSNLKITSLTVAALASVVLANANLNNNVKADNVTDKSTTSEKSQSPEDQAKANVVSAQKNVDTAQKDVDSSKADLDKAKSDAVGPNKAYDDQAAKTKEANENAANKKNALDDANEKQSDAQKLADEATPDAINKARQDVADKNSEIAQKQQDVKNAQAKTSDAQKNVDDANADVNTKKDTLTKANDAKSDADAQVKNAQDALKGTGINEARNAVKTYQNNVNNLKKNISDNQKILESNNTVLKQNKDSLVAANNNLQKAQDEQTKAHSKLSTANTNLKNAKNKLIQDQQLANSAAGFFKALAEDKNLTSEQREDAKTAYGIVMNDGKYQNVKLTWYDKGMRLGQSGDATSLDKMKEALNDLDDLIKVRDQYKLRHPKISLTAMAVAMMSSDYLTTHAFDHPINHENTDGPFFSDEEDIAYGSSQVGQYMDEKNWIDNLIDEHPEYAVYRYDTGNLTYDQWNKNNEFWEKHGLILSGGGDKVIGHYVSMVNPYQDGIGVGQAGIYSSIDILPEYNYKKVLIDSTTTDGETTNTYKLVVNGLKDSQSFTVNEFKNLVNKYVSAIQNGQEKDQPKFIQDDFAVVDSASQERNTAKRLLDNSNDAIEKINDNIQTLTAAIAETKSAITDTNNQILSDSSILKNQKDKLNAAKARLSTLTASNEEKTKNLEKAVQAQTNAEQNIKDATKALSDAETNLANAQKAQSDLKEDIANKQKLVEKAQGELTSLQARQSQLEGAHQALENAKQVAQQAQNEYDTAKKAASDAKTQLDALKTTKDTADAKVKTAQDKYDQAKDKLSDAQAKLTHAKQVLYDLEHPVIYVDNSSEEKPAEEIAKTSTNEGEKTTPIIKKSTSVKIEFVRNAYVYTINGKIVKHHGKRYLIRKGHKTVALNNAKIVKINGKKFYQIAKNEYVKVVNTMTEARKVNVRAIVKGRKNQKVRTYSSTGKFTHHYVYGKRSYKFTSKKNIKGKTYYKLSGKNVWVLVSKLILK